LEIVRTRTIPLPGSVTARQQSHNDFLTLAMSPFFYNFAALLLLNQFDVCVIVTVRILLLLIAEISV